MDLTFDVDFARRGQTDRVVDVTIVDAVGGRRSVDGQNTLEAHADNVFVQAVVVEHPSEIDQFRIGLGFANQTRFAFHFAHRDRTFRFD